MPLYRSHVVSPLISTWSPPPFLWGWFKMNEGSGTVIYDYSGRQNGTLVAWNLGAPNATQQNYFWNTTPGFGTQNVSITNFAKLYRTGPTQDTKYMSCMVFVKPIAQDCTPLAWLNPLFQAGEDGTQNYLYLGWRDNSAETPFWGMWSSFSVTLSPTFGTWYCIYAFSERATTNTGMYIRASGGAFQAALTGVAAPVGTGTQNVIQTCGTNSSNSLAVGDVLCWADVTSGGLISLSQANNVYDNLKSRYGMT